MDIEKLDLRTRERYLRKGLIAQKDVDSYLEALPDSADNAELLDYERVFAEQDRAERAAVVQAAARAPEAAAPRAPAAAEAAASDDDDDDDDDAESTDDAADEAGTAN